MNNKYFTIIVTILGLILLGIFTAWLLVDRGYIQVDTTKSPVTGAPAESVFPTDASNSGASDNTGGFIFQPADNSSSNIVLSGNQVDKQLAKLDTKPVGALLSVGQGTSTILFFERITGNLFQFPPAAVGSPFRVSNTTMPRVTRAWGGVSALTTNFIIRTNNDRLETKLASLTRSASSSDSLFWGGEEEVGGAPTTLTLKVAPAAAFDFAVSPAEDQLATLERTGRGADLVLNNWLGAKREVVGSLPLSQLTLSWPASTTIAIQTKPSYAADGLLYFYNTKTKKLNRIMAGVKGLSALVSPDARYVLYSGSSNNSFFTALYDRNTGKIDRLPFKTLAEKCVWGIASDLIYCGVPNNAPEGNYPDAWYQGLAPFADNLWALELTTKKAMILFNPELNNLGEKIDAAQLTIDESSQQLYLVNKNDFSLWRLSLGSGF